MKRLATLVLVAGLSLGSLLSLGQGASATPFSDVPANHWAYQAIQSLAADGLVEGYPDGKFKGDRPLSRYEMAVIVARVIAKLEANSGNGASKADLDKLQKLIDALKDELDALGVRVTNLEDSLDALDKRTKFAQSLSMSAALLHNPLTFRQRVVLPRSIVNTTGAAQATYYGATVAPGRTGGVDPFVNAFISTPDSNSPFEQQGPGLGNSSRFDDKFTLRYKINDNLTVSFPFHVVNVMYGGEYSQQVHYGFSPGIDVSVNKAGALTNIAFKAGILDDYKPSRTGLAFRPPDGGAGYGYVAFENPLQPYPKGVSVGATLLGLTDFKLSFARLDQTELYTAPNLLDPYGGGVPFFNAYLFPVVAPQGGYNQNGPAGGPAATISDSFSAGNGPLSQVFLTRKGVAGTVYVSAYNGAAFNNKGTNIGGTAGVAAPGFTFNEVYNSVVFATPLPAGSTVTITYSGLTATGNTNWQRYMITGRVNQKIKGYAGAEIGLTYNRIFDFDDLQTTGDLTAIQSASPQGFGLVSDTVFGIDFQLPIPYAVSGKGSFPVLFGEAATSKFTPDYRNVPAYSDTAGVIGLRIKIAKIDASIQYQSVGPDFLDGAPFRFYGNSPTLFNFYKLPYFPAFYGFGNNLAINQQFDQALIGVGRTSVTAGNPALTFAYPLFNPLQYASSPFLFSAFTPNTRGVSGNITAPIRLGDVTLNGRLTASHLEEIRANSFGQLVYGPGVSSTVREKWDLVKAGATFTLPAFGTKLNFNVEGQYDQLKRDDKTPYAYIPTNPGTQVLDAGSAAGIAAGFPGAGSPVSFYPNFVNMRHGQFDARVGVPLTAGVVMNLRYNTQRFGGSYGTTVTQNISQRKDYMVGDFTYTIPKTTSSITFQARQNKYTDDVVPTFNLTQNRQDIFFNVRF